LGGGRRDRGERKLRKIVKTKKGDAEGGTQQREKKKGNELPMEKKSGPEKGVGAAKGEKKKGLEGKNITWSRVECPEGGDRARFGGGK